MRRCNKSPAGVGRNRGRGMPGFGVSNENTRVDMRSDSSFFPTRGCFSFADRDPTADCAPVQLQLYLIMEMRSRLRERYRVKSR